MAYNMNEADEQRRRETIPDGTFVKLKLAIKPGFVDGPEASDKGLLTASTSSDALYLACECTVMIGPYAKRKVFPNYTVSGGKVDEKGQSKGWNISKSAMRAMLESAQGIRPDDMSDAAKQKRQMPGFKYLDGIEFAAKLGIEESEGYAPKNLIEYILTPADAEWESVMQGKEVPAKPSGAGKRGGAAKPKADQPAWATGAAPQQQAPTASAPAWAAPAAESAPTAGAPAGPAWLNK